VTTGSASAPSSIVRNTVFALLVQATTITFTAATTLVVVRLLGPTDFGVFALALGLAGIVGPLARFGVQGSVARFIAENRSDPAACALLLRDALRLVLLTAALASTALVVAAPAIAAAYNDESLVWPLRGVAVALFAETVFALYLNTFVALARVAVNLRLVFIESAAEAAATLALVVAGTGAAGAAFGRAVGYGLGAAIAVATALRLLGRVSGAVWSQRSGNGSTAQIRRYALPLFLLDGLYGLYTRVDVLFVGALLSTTAVGVLAAPKRLLPTLETVGVAVANSVAPRQTAADGGPRVDAFTAAIRWLVILHAALIAPLIVWADPIVDVLFGSEYAESAEVLRWLCPYVLLSGVSPVISTTVNFLGHAGRRIPIALGALAINVAINIALLPRIGVAAAAIGTSAALWLYVPAHLRICRLELGVPLRPLLLSFLRALTAAAAMAGVLLLVGGTQTLSVGTALLGTVLGLVVYTGTLALTREISVTHPRRWLGVWRTRLLKD
jgi:O-antigen/teichoic acid export membrane protein